MRFYLNQSVLDAAKDRIRWVFDRFEHVYVGFSGGKDSTVTLNLAMAIATERGRLPLSVVFVDQEAEWQATIDYVETVMLDTRVHPLWLQVPIKLFNATSTEQAWLQCWEPGQEWMREKHPMAIKENYYGTDRFVDMFRAFLATNHPASSAVYLAGVRCEESPARMLGLTTRETFQGETWGMREGGKANPRDHFAFYPIYDWSYTDVWKAIHEHGWSYNRLYDIQYQYGVGIRDMRVSNVHHETAVKTLFYLQEFEPETWNALTRRIGGINSAGHMQASFYGPKTLPSMFKDWREYRDYLLDNLITNETHKIYFRETFATYDARYDDPKARADLVQTQIAMLLVNDTHGTKLGTFRSSHFMQAKTVGSRTVGGAY